MILAGGLGTRLREETEFRPKPMVPIGGKPILWHIMKIYAHYGFRRFIICLGYKGEMIKDYFLTYHLQGIDFTLHTKTNIIVEHQSNDDNWEITLVDTGFDCLTGGRIARASRYIDTDTFLLTYGDGLSNIDINQLLTFHHSHDKLITLTGIQPTSRFGYLDIVDNQVTSFSEKKRLNDEWINGGFFVINKKFLPYLSTNADCIFEQQPLRSVAQNGQLMMYKHNGFWQCMDTLREQEQLEELWKTSAPWKVWQDKQKEFKPSERIHESNLPYE